MFVAFAVHLQSFHWTNTAFIFLAAKRSGGHSGPTRKGPPESCRIVEAQCEADVFIHHRRLSKVFFSQMGAQFVDEPAE